MCVLIKSSVCDYGNSSKICILNLFCCNCILIANQVDLLVIIYVVFSSHVALNPFFGMRIVFPVSLTHGGDARKVQDEAESLCDPKPFSLPCSRGEFAQTGVQTPISAPAHHCGSICHPSSWALETLVFHDQLSADRCLRKVPWLEIVCSIILSVE